MIRAALFLLVLGLTHPSWAQVQLNREDAMNFPSRHAWNLFLNLNHPAKDMSLGRGLPDLTKPIGAPGTTAVWETWRQATPEVFLPDGTKPPEWDTLTPGRPPNAKVPEPPKQQLIARYNESIKSSGGATIQLDPRPGEGLPSQPGEGGFGETRMNRSTFDFVRENGLYNVEGQRAFAEKILNKEVPLMSFPVESIEVKAAWRELTNDEAQSGRYYLGEVEVEGSNGQKSKKTFGLVTLHIITKDIPNWFWATFHHKDSPSSGFETSDKYAMPPALQNTVWENYSLGGTQTDFVNSIGEPTLLSDAYIEKGFERSSCISCHARATRAAVEAPGLSSVPVVGIPIPGLFIDRQPELVQTDFLFSLAFRARRLNPATTR